MTHKLFSRFIVLFSILIASSAWAESSISVTTGLVTGKQALTKFIPQTELRLLDQRKRPISTGLAVSIAGLGRVEFDFTAQHSPDSIPVIYNESGTHKDLRGVTFLSGTAKVRGQSVLLSATISERDGDQTLRALFRYGRKASRTQMYSVSIPLTADHTEARVARAGRQAAINSQCQTMHSGHSSDDFSFSGHSHQVNGSSSKTLELAAFGDKAWNDHFGSEATQEITDAVFRAKTEYSAQLGIDITAVSTVLLATKQYGNPVGSEFDAETTLTEFQSDIINNSSKYGTADAYHLFTAQDIQGGTIGLAYLSVICNSQANSFGYSQVMTNLSADDASAAVALTLIHELGHNFGADHDSSEPKTIMFPSISGTSEFSTFSKNQINSHTSLFPQCLTSDQGSGDDTTGGDGSSTGGDSGTGGDSTGGDSTSGDDGGSSGGGSGTSGGSNGGDAVNLDIAFNANLDTSTGLINISSNVTNNESNYSDPDCTIYYRMGTKRKKISFATPFYSAGLTSSSMALSGTLPRAKNRNKKGRLKYFLAATVSCAESGSGGESSPVKLNAQRIKGKKRVSTGRLRKALQSLLP